MAGWVLMAALLQTAPAQTAPPPVPTVHSEPLAGSLPPLDTPDEQGARGPGRFHQRGPVFLSPMGEPFHGHDPQYLWFDQADTNHDGVLSLAEFEADAARWFAVLDREHDGEIDPEDIDYYEKFLAPEIRVGGGGGAGFGGRGTRGSGGGGRGGRGGGGHRGGGGGYGGGRGGGAGQSQGSAPAQQSYGRQGAARYGWFDYPEPITVADTNFNRGVDRTEWRSAADARFAILDKHHTGAIKRSELPALPAAGAGGGRGGERRRGEGAARPVEGEPTE